MLKIPKKINLDKTVKDALKDDLGLSNDDITSIAACTGTPVEIEDCVKKLLSKTMDSKRIDETWEFLYHFVIVGKD